VLERATDRRVICSQGPNALPVFRGASPLISAAVGATTSRLNIVWDGEVFGFSRHLVARGGRPRRDGGASWRTTSTSSPPR
jgi:hypothetical protein